MTGRDEIKAVYESHSFELPDWLKFDPGQARDERGRWASTGGRVAGALRRVGGIVTGRSRAARERGAGKRIEKIRSRTPEPKNFRVAGAMFREKFGKGVRLTSKAKKLRTGQWDFERNQMGGNLNKSWRKARNTLEKMGFGEFNDPYSDREGSVAFVRGNSQATLWDDGRSVIVDFFEAGD
jgi:hypothetical protein